MILQLPESRPKGLITVWWPRLKSCTKNCLGFCTQMPLYVLLFKSSATMTSCQIFLLPPLSSQRSKLFFSKWLCQTQKLASFWGGLVFVIYGYVRLSVKTGIKDKCSQLKEHFLRAPGNRYLIVRSWSMAFLTKWCGLWYSCWTVEKTVWIFKIPSNSLRTINLKLWRRWGRQAGEEEGGRHCFLCKMFLSASLPLLHHFR